MRRNSTELNRWLTEIISSGRALLGESCLQWLVINPVTTVCISWWSLLAWCCWRRQTLIFVVAIMQWWKVQLCPVRWTPCIPMFVINWGMKLLWVEKILLLLPLKLTAVMFMQVRLSASLIQLWDSLCSLLGPVYLTLWPVWWWPEKVNIRVTCWGVLCEWGFKPSM